MQKAGDDIEKRGLAATARADEAEKFRSFHLKTCGLYADHAPGRRVVDERYVADLDMGHERGSQPFAVCIMPQRSTVARSSDAKASRSNSSPITPITASAASMTSAFKNSLL